MDWQIYSDRHILAKTLAVPRLSVAVKNEVPFVFSY